MYQRTLFLISLCIAQHALHGAVTDATQGILTQANALFCTSKYARAIPLYEQFLATDPQSPELDIANVNLAQCLIAHSVDTNNPRFMRRAWPLFEHRIPLEIAAGKRAALTNELTPGTAIAGKIIEIVAAGPDGFGDVCTIVPKYAPILGQQLGAYVVVRLSAQHRCLAELLERTPGVDKTVTAHTPIESIPESDYQINLMSLPGLFSSLGACPTIPSIIPQLHAPGISVDPALVARYKSLMSPGTLNIAICWFASPNPVAGDTRIINRNIPLAHLTALAAQLSQSGYPIKLWSVQGQPTEFVTASQYKAVQDEDPADAATINAEFDVIPDEHARYITQVKDNAGPFLDTAAVIEACDGFAGCDTVFPNLAATMYKPTWLLLTKHANMRWGTKGEDTPWFAENMTLLRQEKQGDWSAPLKQLTATLTAMAQMAQLKKA